MSKKPDVSEAYGAEYVYDEFCPKNPPSFWMILFGINGHDWAWFRGGAAIIQPGQHLYGHATGRQFMEATCLNCEQKKIEWKGYY